MAMSARTVAAAPLAGTTATVPMPDFRLEAEGMTAEQIAFLDEWGFIKFRGFADAETVRELVAEVEEVDRRIVAEGRTIINGVPLVIGRRADGTKYVQRMAFTSLFGPRL